MISENCNYRIFQDCGRFIKNVNIDLKNSNLIVLDKSKEATKTPDTERLATR